MRAADPSLAPLWDELARRMGASSAPVVTVTLRGLGDENRRALADLLGLERLPAATCQVRVTHLCGALGTDYPGLRERVASLRGPLTDRSAQRAAERAERAQLWAWLAESVSGLGLGAWAARLQAAGVPGGDVAAHRARLGFVVAVLGALPANGMSLAGLAADVMGDPHGLDYGTWAGSVVLEALAFLGREGVPRTAEQARAVWAAFGVAADALSPSVLALSLAPLGADPLSVVLRALAPGAEPAAITLSQLRRWPVTSVTACDVYVFENPSMLAEAATRAWAGPPLVCTSGWPNVAVLTLLRQLSACGCRLHLHADWDRAGLAIVHLLSERVGGDPWEMPPARPAGARIAYEEDHRTALLAAVLASP